MLITFIFRHAVDRIGNTREDTGEMVEPPVSLSWDKRDRKVLKTNTPKTGIEIAWLRIKKYLQSGGLVLLYRKLRQTFQPSCMP